MIEAKITNPFWDEAAKCFAASSDADEHKIYSAAWYRKFNRSISQREERYAFCAKYCWAVPDPASIAFVAEHLGAKAVEIGAGTGYWAWMLAQSGVDILAYEIAPPDRVLNEYFGVYDIKSHTARIEIVKTWHPVMQGGPEVLTGHADRTLFLCWPPFDDGMAWRCLKRYQGRRLVFIGEYQGGCTADDAFFEELDEHWEEVATHRIVQWYAMNDVIRVYERKERDEKP